MQVFELVLLLAAAVLLSSVLEQILPKISLPLIQIALGAVIAVLAVTPIEVTLSPEFFLVVFIAPLLFNEAKESDKLGLWKNRGTILSLAIGLVLAIVIAVGFSVHWLIPSIPLAAAFALGAALGPTDAVAVTSLRSSAELSRKESALLSGESLLNDATGVVAFQFAIAAAVTGAFSVADASISFVVSFFGGIVLGLALGWLAHFIQTRLAEMGLDSNTFHVLFDIMLPFIIFLVSEMFHVSGILAVVAAGLLLSSYSERRIGPSVSRLSIVSTSVWNVLTFTLNGIVFVMLGMQLPRAMQSTWDSVVIDNLALVGYILIITAILVVVRFLWIELVGHITHDPETGKPRFSHRHSFRSAMVSTLGGPKGAVTLSVIFATPLLLESGEAFPQRDLMIFLASGVILCTLLLANFLLPVFAPKAAESNDDAECIARAKVDIMRSVIEGLMATRTKDTARATGAVISSYNNRIERIQNMADIESSSTTQLRCHMIEYQQERLFDRMLTGEIDEVAGYDYLKKLVRAHGYLQHRNDGTLQLMGMMFHGSAVLRLLRRYLTRRRDSSGRYGASAEIDIQLASETDAIGYLHRMIESDDRTFPPEVVSQVLMNYQSGVRALENAKPNITQYARVSDRMGEVERHAYQIELEEIQAAQDRNDIGRNVAKEMRDNVYLMLVDLDAHKL